MYQFRSVCVGRDILLPISAPGDDGRPRYALPGTADAPIPLLSYNPESALGWIVNAAVVASGVSPHFETAFKAHLAIVLLAMVREGRGIAWLPLSLVEDELASGFLLRAGTPEWHAGMEIHLFRPRARQSPPAEAFWAMLKN